MSLVKGHNLTAYFNPLWDLMRIEEADLKHLTAEFEKNLRQLRQKRMRTQLHRVVNALMNKPDGLTILQLTRAINNGLETEFSPSTVSCWTKEGVKLGFIEEDESKGKIGRPAKIFKVKAKN